MVHGRYLVDMLRCFICLVALFEDHIGAQQNNVYFEKGESVILFCKVNATSWCTWDGPGVNGGEFSTFSDRMVIDQSLPNANRLMIIGNISLGEYNLQISNASNEDEGAYRCSIVDGAARQTHVFLQMKEQPSNISVNGANKGVRHGIEGRPLVLNCSVTSGIPDESILWYNGSVLLDIGGPGIFSMTIVPQRYDHDRIYTCIVNSSALRVPLKTSIMLDIKYKPVLTLNSDKPLRRLSNTDQIEIHIDEGHNLTISCSVDSNPPVLKVNFYRNLHQVKNVKSAHTLEFIGIKREDKGLYECRAKNEVDETYENVTVIVEYPPSIVITKYFENTGLQCSPEGKPQNYTFHPWLHHSELGDFIRQLDNNEIVRFKEVGINTQNYKWNGIYTCRAENGIKDVNGTLIQSGQVLVKQAGQNEFYSEVMEKFDDAGDIYSFVKCLFCKQ
ncbi:unnamed protein product [Mytilus edulis]|uniref:Ig-like domain-containing protein n=1 Tax=Mytilus edulis TaxID=6550 RepID=A0A8S3QKW6_MYTED|nr:unnamed protein product [Mytilus edulis]